MGNGKHNPSKDYHGSHKFEAEWANKPDVRHWIDQELLRGEVLNLCCGQSPLGDLQLDIDPAHDPDIVADLHNPPFKPMSFDTVLVDPPFALYSYSHGYWPREVWKIPRKRLVLMSPAKRVQLPDSVKEWYVLEPKPGASRMAVQMLQVFDRASKPFFTTD